MPRLSPQRHPVARAASSQNNIFASSVSSPNGGHGKRHFISADGGVKPSIIDTPNACSWWPPFSPVLRLLFRADAGDLKGQPNFNVLATSIATSPPPILNEGNANANIAFRPDGRAVKINGNLYVTGCSNNGEPQDTRRSSAARYSAFVLRKRQRPRPPSHHI